jgi:sporulation protein YlmC with PRC-barrel domain
MFKPIAIATMLATFGAASAYAQTTVPPATPAPAPMAAPTPMPGATTDAAKLIGRNIKNTQNETIGEIKSVYLDSTGKVDGVIVGVGGFLGMGEREVRLAWRDLNVSNNGETVVVAMTKDQLKSMPEYKYPDQAWRGNVFNDSGIYRPDGGPRTATDTTRPADMPRRDAARPAETRPGEPMRRDGARPGEPVRQGELRPDGTRTAPGAPLPGKAFNAEGHMSANAIIGASVKNTAKETVGEVEDIFVDQSGAPKTVVVSVGGFLGLGAKNVAVPWSELTFARDGNDLVLMTNWTKDSLKTMPEYEPQRAAAPPVRQ